MGCGFLLLPASHEKNEYLEEIINKCPGETMNTPRKKKKITQKKIIPSGKNIKNAYKKSVIISLLLQLTPDSRKNSI